MSIQVSISNWGMRNRLFCADLIFERFPFFHFIYVSLFNEDSSSQRSFNRRDRFWTSWDTWERSLQSFRPKLILLGWFPIGLVWLWSRFIGSSFKEPQGLCQVVSLTRSWDLYASRCGSGQFCWSVLLVRNTCAKRSAAWGSKPRHQQICYNGALSVVTKNGRHLRASSCRRAGATRERTAGGATRSTRAEFKRTMGSE